MMQVKVLFISTEKTYNRTQGLWLEHSEYFHLNPFPRNSVNVRDEFDKLKK